MAEQDLHVSATVIVPDQELDERFVHASGPGGQNVNKLSTAVELRFDARRSPSLPEPVRERLQRLAGRRLTLDGVIVILAQRFRTQEANRRDARARLLALLRDAAAPPAPPRRPTRPTLASKTRRLETKSGRSQIKRMRRVPTDD